MDSRLLVAVILKVFLIDVLNSQPQQDGQWNPPDQMALLSSIENKIMYMNSKLEEKLSLLEGYVMEMTSRFTGATQKFADLERQMNRAGVALDLCLARHQQMEVEPQPYSTSGRQDLSEKVEGYGKKILRALQTVLDTLNKPPPKSDYQESILRNELKKIMDKVEEIAASLNSNLITRNLSGTLQNLLLRSDAQDRELLEIRDKIIYVGNRLDQICGPLDGKLQAVLDSVSQMEVLGNLTSVLAAAQLEEAVQINKRCERRTAELGDLEAQLLHAMRLGNDLANGLSKLANIPDSLRSIAYNLSLLLTGMEQSTNPLLISIADNHNALSVILGEMWQAIADKKYSTCFACRNSTVAEKMDFVELRHSLSQKLSNLECNLPPAQQQTSYISGVMWTDMVGQLKLLNNELNEHKGDVTAKMAVLYAGLERIANTMDSISSGSSGRRPPIKLLENLLGR